jgi:hypothetical protein
MNIYTMTLRMLYRRTLRFIILNMEDPYTYIRIRLPTDRDYQINPEDLTDQHNPKDLANPADHHSLVDQYRLADLKLHHNLVDLINRSDHLNQVDQTDRINQHLLDPEDQPSRKHPQEGNQPARQIQISVNLAGEKATLVKRQVISRKVQEVPVEPEADK